MKTWSRRRFIRQAAAAGAALATAACRERVVRVQELVEVEKEVTKVITAIVRETVVVGETQIVERTVEKVVTAPPAPQPKVVVVADVMNYGWTRYGILVSPAFQELFPHITVAWRGLDGWAGYPEHVEALAAAGELGDLVESPLGALVIRWAQRSVTQPLDSLIAVDGFDLEGVFRGALAACTHGHELAAMPFIAHAGENLLLYNQHAFKDAGADPPGPQWTLDDLEAASRALTRQDGRPPRFGYGVRYDLPSAYPMLHLFGARLLSEDGRNCALDSRNGVDCLTWAHEQVYSHRLAPQPWQINRGLQRMLLLGELAMLRHSFRTFMHLTGPSLDGLSLGATLMPRHPTSRRVGALATGMAYGITRGSAAPREAFQWIKFMSSREMGVQMLLGGYAEPGCRRASWGDPRVVERYPVCAEVADTADDAPREHLPWNLRTEECLGAWNSRVPALLADEIPPEQCAREICQAIEQVLRPLPPWSPDAL
ncbi:MAG: extracellular solute-binding protein [Chloroflexi bacterium]|nr:extracellular solute-binding protein [Chloroflexota bacterium]